jgi:hypothetical protein
MSQDAISTIEDAVMIINGAEKTVSSMSQTSALDAFNIRGPSRARRKDCDAWVEQQASALTGKYGPSEP